MSSISYADLVIDRFQNWPPGRALALHGLQVVHLHGDDSAEVFLTQPVIGRLDAALSASGRVDIFADAGWVQVRLDTESDLFLLQSLVSLAIQAHDPTSRMVRHTITTCPRSLRESEPRTSRRKHRVVVRRSRANVPA
jgi:hypothetical protein